MGAKKQFKDQGQIHSVDLACYHAVHDYPGGVKGVAAVFGWVPGLLQNKINPTQQGHKLSARELEMILELTGDERILMAVGAAANAVFIPVPDQDAVAGDVDLLECGNDVHGGAFGFVNEAVKSLADGKIDAIESKRIQKQLYTLMSRCYQLLELTKQFEDEGED